MALCKTCGATPDTAEFYEGIGSHCKEHWKERVRLNRESRADQYREYEKTRANRPDRVAARAAYQQTEAGKAALKRSHDAYRQRHPARRAAQVALGNAVRDGKVVPWPVCALPACSDKPEAHHPDYSRALDVVWLCPAHHRQAHALIDARLESA